METVVLLCQAGGLALLAAWLSVALYDNWRHPEINAQYTREVLSLARIARDFPGVMAELGARRILNPRVQRAVFIAVVVAETLVVVLLWLAMAALLAAAVGLVEPVLARALGMLGAFGFVAIWAGFVIAGNYFCYWLCHEGAQNTHFQLVLWGMSMLLLLGMA